jgi:glutamine cyclotransferase
MLRRFEHPHAPWTQGLEFSSDGRLVETCGDFPTGVGSFVRVLDPESGKLQRSISDGLVDEAGKSRFIEGIVEREGRWYATTYHDKLAIEYDNDFKVVGTHRYPFNGWGLAVSSNGQSFLATNGTEYVMSLRVGTWELESTRVAHCMGRRIVGLNELEMVEDLAGTGPALLGNVVNTRLVLAMDPKTMTCTGVFHLEDTEPVEQNERAGYHVANGIAYNKKARSFFITGKNWKSMYEVDISKTSSSMSSGAGDGARAIELLESHLTFADRYDAPPDPSTPM